MWLQIVSTAVLAVPATHLVVETAPGCSCQPENRSLHFKNGNDEFNCQQSAGRLAKSPQRLCSFQFSWLSLYASNARKERSFQVNLTRVAFMVWLVLLCQFDCGRGFSAKEVKHSPGHCRIAHVVQHARRCQRHETEGCDTTVQTTVQVLVQSTPIQLH